MSIESSSDRSESTLSKAWLRRLPLFADLADDDLDRLYEMAETVSVPRGERFIEEGSPGDELFIVIEGEIEITHREGNREVVLATRGAGEFIGEMSLLQKAPRSASVRTLRDSQMLVIRQAAFETLLSCSPTAPLTILRTMIARLRSNESLLMQQEKLAALGTLAAGLAHELNNPAAAIRRSTAQLRGALQRWEEISAGISALDLEPAQRAALLALREKAGQRGAEAGALDPLTRGDREDEVQGWLEMQGVERAWEMAPALVTAGLSREALQELAGPFGEAQLPLVVRWLAAGAEVYGLLEEAGTSAEAISHLVSAVKSYTRLDQAPIQDVDVHESLENTLVIMRYKTRQGISITREYAADLPRIEAYASELNQVWTNLIDNAIDAMQGRGSLRLRTCRRDDEVIVEISDSGPGIPAEAQPRIFEPFFTTKDPGQGTGLGLHIVYNIVVHRHRGGIRFDSRPGETRFQVSLPLRLARG